MFEFKVISYYLRNDSLVLYCYNFIKHVKYSMLYDRALRAALWNALDGMSVNAQSKNKNKNKNKFISEQKKK